MLLVGPTLHVQAQSAPVTHTFGLSPQNTYGNLEIINAVVQFEGNYIGRPYQQVQHMDQFGGLAGEPVDFTFPGITLPGCTVTSQTVVTVYSNRGTVINGYRTTTFATNFSCQDAAINPWAVSTVLINVSTKTACRYKTCWAFVSDHWTGTVTEQ